MHLFPFPIWYHHLGVQVWMFSIIASTCILATSCENDPSHCKLPVRSFWCILRSRACLCIALTVGGVWDEDQHLLQSFLGFTIKQWQGQPPNSPQSKNGGANLCAELHQVWYFQHSASYLSVWVLEASWLQIVQNSLVSTSSSIASLSVTVSGLLRFFLLVAAWGTLTETWELVFYDRPFICCWVLKASSVVAGGYSLSPSETNANFVVGAFAGDDI